MSLAQIVELMHRHSVLLFFFNCVLFIVTPDCRASESNVQVTPVARLSPDAQQAARTLIAASQKPASDTPKLFSSIAFKVQHGDQVSVFIPVISTQNSVDREPLQQCQLIVVKTENRHINANFLKRRNSGFSDDYEPCVAISRPIFIDVNGDGTQDVILSITRTNGVRKEYLLGEVYLVGTDAQLCHSPEASTVFIPDGQQTISEDEAKRIIVVGHKRLSSLKCPKVELFNQQAPPPWQFVPPQEWLDARFHIDSSSYALVAFEPKG